MKDAVVTTTISAAAPIVTPTTITTPAVATAAIIPKTSPSVQGSPVTTMPTPAAATNTNTTIKKQPDRQHSTNNGDDCSAGATVNPLSALLLMALSVYVFVCTGNMH